MPSRGSKSSTSGKVGVRDPDRLARVTQVNSELSSLIARWRTDAAVFRRYGRDADAYVLELHATEVEAALQRTADEVLTLPQAATVSGYSAEHLGRLIRDAKLRNAGRPNAPRVRRGDLPSKPAPQRLAERTDNVYRLDRLFRDVATSKRGA